MRARLLLLFIALALVPGSTQPHNGSLAVAAEAITINSDLSDWPADLQIYPIRHRVGESALSSDPNPSLRHDQHSSACSSSGYFER